MEIPADCHSLILQHVPLDTRILYQQVCKNWFTHTKEITRKIKLNERLARKRFKVTPNFFRFIASRFPQLEELDLNGANIGKIKLFDHFKGCQSLKIIKLNGNASPRLELKLTRKFNFVSWCTCMHHYFPHYSAISTTFPITTPSDSVTIKKHLDNLMISHLKVSHMSDFDPIAFKAIVQSASQTAKHLIVHTKELTLFKLLEDLLKSKTITNLYCFDIKGITPMLFSKIPNITSLHVQTISMEKAEIVANCCPMLVTLSISEELVNSDPIDYLLGNLAHLKKLKIKALTRPIKKLSLLEILKCRSNFSGYMSVVKDSLPNLPSLKVLNVELLASDIPSIIKYCKVLKEVYMAYWGLTLHDIHSG